MEQNAFVTSELDLNDSLLYGLFKKKLDVSAYDNVAVHTFVKAEKLHAFLIFFFYVFTGYHFTRELIEFKILLVTLKVLHVFIEDRNSLI